MSSFLKKCQECLIFVTILAFSVITFYCQPAVAYNPQHQQNLDQNRKCVKCDFSGINLSGTFLNAVDISGANISKANSSYPVLMSQSM